MTNTEPTPDQPLDEHLEEDISTETDTPDKEQLDFAPGQTNAGQQVGGLMGAIQDPEDEHREKGNNPI